MLLLGFGGPMGMLTIILFFAMLGGFAFLLIAIFYLYPIWKREQKLKLEERERRDKGRRK